MAEQEQSSKRICIAKIAAPHGVKGLVKILPQCEDVSLIEGVEDFDITLKNALGKYILASIEGVNSREDAEAIQGRELYIDRDRLPEAEDGEYYYDDLIGLNALDENGDTVGKIVSVQNYGAGDLLEIKPEAGGETYLLPFTDDYVPAVHDDHVVVRPLEME